jgi:hypothetical protein
MAINTRNRRASTDLEMPYQEVGFSVDGSVNQGDRQAIGRCYAGIDAGVVAPGRGTDDTGWMIVIL